MSTIPLPHAAIVQSIQSVQPFSPGDILMIQSATTQANIPVLVLGINKLDPAQFILDTSTDPDTVRINTGAGGVTDDPAWTVFTPTFAIDGGVIATPTTMVAAYLKKGKTVQVRVQWAGTLVGAAGTFMGFSGFPDAISSAGIFQALSGILKSDGFFVGNFTAWVDAGTAGISLTTGNFAAAVPIQVSLNGVYETI